MSRGFSLSRAVCDGRWEGRVVAVCGETWRAAARRVGVVKSSRGRCFFCTCEGISVV